MNVICPSCNADYNIPEARIPANGAKAACKRCGGEIVIKPPASISTAPITPKSKPEAGAPAEPSGAPPGQKPPTPSAGGTGANHPSFSDYPRLRELASPHLDLDEILTTNKKGGYKNGKNKIKIQILAGVAPMLNDVLEKDEVVKKVARGIANYPLELIFGNGALTLLYNRYAILCTDRRVLMINTTYRMKRPTHYLFQIPYQYIAKVKRGYLFTNLTIYRKAGKKRIFTYVDRFSLKEVTAFIITQIEGARPAGKLKALFDDLCPSCYVPLEKGLRNCSHCHIGFKTPKAAFLKSLLLPGWGDLYLGHRFLGSMELLVSICLWLFVVSLLFSPDKETVIVGAVMIVVFNVMDSLLTLHMARKGYMAA